MHLRIFITGGASISGNGFSNPNDALNLQLYGVDTYPDGTVRGTPGEAVNDIWISGNGEFKGAVYAPRFHIAFSGGGNTANAHLFGSFVGLHLRMTGIQQVHYDERMAAGGIVVDYKIASCFEDIR